MLNLKYFSLDRVHHLDSFLKERSDLMKNTVIPYQWRVLSDAEPNVMKSHALKNFKIAADEEQGQFEGWVFQDSDLYKWLEAVGYSLATEPNDYLTELADSVIDLIEKVQQKDGYLDTYFIIKEPDKKWTNVRDLHEMYCAGHLIEAAVSYYKATNKTKLLDIACRLADHIDDRFGPQLDKLPGYPGHPELELALVKLYNVTGQERYLRLSKYFIDQRGQKPHFFETEAKKRNDTKAYNNKYSQSHLPVREQETAEGHAVRAMYLFSAMADLARETKDFSLLETCKKLWKNVTRKRMYITGGIGSEATSEGFTIDYDLPNERAYAETCASIGLVMWAHRMLCIDLNSDYADVMERVLYNGLLSGMALDGKHYFYVNPLEVWPKTVKFRRPDLRDVEVTRESWFSCACCPPNLARLMTSLTEYIYSYDGSSIYVHLYSSSQVNWEIGSVPVTVLQKTNYPWDEDVTLKFSLSTTAHFKVFLRIPSWCKKSEIFLNSVPIEKNDKKLSFENGYACIDRNWKDNDEIHMIFPMPVEEVHANPEVREDIGKIVLQRGPVVFCLEEVDNGKNLPDIVLSNDPKFEVHKDSGWNGIHYITALATRSLQWGPDVLYMSKEKIAKKRTSIKVKAIPYFAWANREPGEMLVWVKQK